MALKLGIPKGSLEKATIDLFAQAGWSIAISSRNYFPTINDPAIRTSLVRPQEMAPYVADGTLDLGLTGWDWIVEQDCAHKVEEVAVLEYSKSSDQPCRWVLVVPKDSPIQSSADLRGKRVATELQNFTRRYFQERGIDCEVIYSWGATEAKVVEGLVDAVVEITETGSTIRAHGLRIVETLMTTETRLIANKAAMADPVRRAQIDQIRLLLTASLRAHHKVGLKMNVPVERMDAVLDGLPSLCSPTVSPLRDPQWMAVETVVDRRSVRTLLPDLYARGARGILEFDIRKMID
ncbi:MAG: ATP phosphoribosyltransferase [Magnetococcus sp. WYHC-3]